MAARALCQRSRTVAYLPGIKTMVRHFRAFSSYDERTPKGDNTYVVVDRSEQLLPDPRLGQLEPHNTRFPMPGMVGPVQGVSSPPVPHHEPSLGDLLSSQMAGDRHVDVLRQFAETLAEDELAGNVDSPTLNLECVAQECPALLMKDLAELFPARDMSRAPLTVITLSQHTEHDMSGWSEGVEAERELLLATFIEGAHDICNALHEAGYWADFIDPSSGRPYLGAYTNATLFETDERYRHFGFEINDLGCCKVISHHIWGTHAYVGSLFTNAPHDHPVIIGLDQKSIE